MTFIPMPEQTFASFPSQTDKMSMVASACSESTTGDLVDSDLSSDSEGFGSSSSVPQDTDDEESDEWDINVKNTFIDIRCPCDSSKHRRRSVPASMHAQPVL